MDKRVLFLSLPFLTFLILHVTCSSIHDIPIPSTARFEQNLSDYAIYQGEMKDLVPTAEYTLLELNSPLFSNYSKKQRLVRLPTGTQMEQNGSGLPTFPDGTVLVKTFFYDIDQRDELLGKQVIETRLEIKSQGVWNVGTYIWNDSLTEATLALDGFDKQVRWTDASGEPQVINYHFPDQRECVSCHQQHAQVQPIGPTLRNLNIDVVRDHTTINQLAYLQSHGLIHSFSIDQTARLPDYRSPDESLPDRARAYLDMNCAHCHNPFAWSESAEQRLDLRFETSLRDSKILYNTDEISRLMEEGEMPYLGTTVVDQEGLSMILEYLESLPFPSRGR